MMYFISLNKMYKYFQLLLTTDLSFRHYTKTHPKDFEERALLTNLQVWVLTPVAL